MTRDTDERGKLAEWMREPDFVEPASLAWLLDWVNRRPLAELAALSNAPAPSEGVRWKPIETAPRNGARILVTGGGLQYKVEVASYNERVCAWDTENYTLDDRDDEAEGYSRPAYWQPLPTPADTEDQGPDTLGERP